jgi:hypothetical protein
MEGDHLVAAAVDDQQRQRNAGHVLLVVPQVRQHPCRPAGNQPGSYCHLAGGREACSNHDAIGRWPQLIDHIEQHRRTERKAEREAPGRIRRQRDELLVRYQRILPQPRALRLISLAHQLPLRSSHGLRLS